MMPPGSDSNLCAQSQRVHGLLRNSGYSLGVPIHMNTPYAIRLLIADSQEIFAVGLKSVLAEVEWLVVIGELNEAMSLFEVLESSRVDMLLLDLGISELTDPHIIEGMRDLKANLRIVVVTAGNESERLRRALQLGAADASPATPACRGSRFGV